MQSLQQQASTASGIPLEQAFAIDQLNLYHKLGHDVFVRLSTEFYNRVYDDPEAWFREIFAVSQKADAIRNQYEFLIQRMGGPPLYSQRKGHPALIGRHAPFPVTAEGAARWLHHMEAALEAVPEVDSDSRQRMLKFFKHTAYFLVAGQQAMQKQSR